MATKLEELAAAARRLGQMGLYKELDDIRREVALTAFAIDQSPRVMELKTGASELRDIDYEKPVIYELTPDGEASGIVHFYCGEFCRGPHLNDFKPSESGTSGDWPYGTVCEHCGEELH